MSQAEIGLIGLGVMGSNLALNIAEKGNRIAVFNRTAARTDAFMASAGKLAADLIPGENHGRLHCQHPPAAPGDHHGEGRRAGG